MSEFDPKSVDFYCVPGEGLVGIPFGVYPSFIYYNRELFDEAGLPYPPHKWGADYADGRPWNIDTLTDVAGSVQLSGQGLPDLSGADT